MSQPKISVVLGSYNRLKFLKLTIESIRKEQENIKIDSEIIVIDGGSTDGTIKWLTKQKDIISIIQHNQNPRRPWGYFMNLGFKCAQGKYICMVSDDCLIVPNAIKNGYELFEKKLQNKEKIGALAFFYRNSPFFYKDWKKPGKYFVNKVFDKIYINHGMYLKEALQEIDYIDEKNYEFYCADVDLSFKLQQHGYACIPAPNSYIEHYMHANIKLRKHNEKPLQKDFLQLQKKWNTFMPEDTAFTSISKEHSDTYQTINQFKKAHFTNMQFWTLVLKEIINKRIGKNREQ